MAKKTVLKEERVLRAKHEYSDARGRIDYYALPEPINWVGVISSKKGSLRANHFHPKQEQKVLMLSGKCISIFKDLSKKDNPVRHYLVGAGDLVVTPPRVAHAVIYLEDTLFLNLVRGERNPANYGKHTKPFELVKPAEIAEYAAKYGVKL